MFAAASRPKGREAVLPVTDCTAPYRLIELLKPRRRRDSHRQACALHRSDIRVVISSTTGFFVSCCFTQNDSVMGMVSKDLWCYFFVKMPQMQLSDRAKRWAVLSVLPIGERRGEEAGAVFSRKRKSSHRSGSIGIKPSAYSLIVIRCRKSYSANILIIFEYQ